MYSLWAVEAFISYLPLYTSYVLVFVYLKDFSLFILCCCFTHMHLCAQFTRNKKFLQQNESSTLHKTHKDGLQIMLPSVAFFAVYDDISFIVYMSFKTCELFKSHWWQNLEILVKNSGYNATSIIIVEATNRSKYKLCNFGLFFWWCWKFFRELNDIFAIFKNWFENYIGKDDMSV